MKQERKYLATDICDALCQSNNERNGDEYNFTEKKLETLIHGWAKHPEYPSPNLNAIRMRNYKHGEFWLSESEIPSFESYVGYKLLKYLD